MNTRRFEHRSGQEQHLQPTTTTPASIADRQALREQDFLRVIWHERKRAERTHKSCLLMLVEMEAQFSGESHGRALGKILSCLSAATRETDVTGWYQNDAVIGVLFTEVMFEDGASIVTKVMTRVSDALRAKLSPLQFNQASVSFHLFPGEPETEMLVALESPALYPDMVAAGESTSLVDARLVQR